MSTSQSQQTVAILRISLAEIDDKERQLESIPNAVKTSPEAGDLWKNWSWCITVINGSNWRTSIRFHWYSKKATGKKAALDELAVLKSAKQVHSNKVLTINNLGQKTNEIEADALVTNQPNIILGILTADCAPVLAFDPINNIIAAIHIGWKGAIKNILSNTIDTFIAMNANTQNIKLAIGPCIGPMSYEVKNDFYEKYHFKCFATRF